MQSLKNFFIAFGVGLIIFGIFAYGVSSLMGSDEKNPGNNNDDFDNVAVVNPVDDDNDKPITNSSKSKTFTAVVGGYDKSGNELDALIFIKADKENARFVLSSIPTNLRVPITSSSNLPADGSENIDIDSLLYNETYIRIKDIPSVFFGEEKQMIVDVVTLITGMPIDYYAFLDYDSVRAIFNKTSGLYYDVPKDMVYIGTGTAENPEFAIYKGEQILNTEKAIAFMRYADDTANERTNYNERAKRQTAFISSAILQVLKGNPEDIISGFATVLKSCDTNFTADAFADNFELISKFSQYSGNNVTVTFDNYTAEILSYKDTSKRFENYK